MQVLLNFPSFQKCAFRSSGAVKNIQIIWSQTNVKYRLDICITALWQSLPTAINVLLYLDLENLFSPQNLQLG